MKRTLFRRERHILEKGILGSRCVCETSATPKQSTKPGFDWAPFTPTPTANLTTAFSKTIADTLLQQALDPRLTGVKS
jgi:hypothetical protein